MQALIVIDMQRWMFRQSERAAQLPSLAPKINNLAHEFSVAGLPIFDVRTSLKADRSNWSRLMLKYDYSCMIEGTADVDPVEDFKIPNSAQLIHKAANSAFLKTDLADQLRAENIDRVALCGVFLHGCVALTAADAEQLGFGVLMVDDGIGHREEQ